MGEFIVFILHLAAAVVAALIGLACLYPIFYFFS
jgi:hypothetical protein